VINHPSELPARGIHGKHTFSCALPTRGGICDCLPEDLEDLSVAAKPPASQVANPAILATAPQAVSASEG
jgi:hypothetical protein